MKKNLAGRILIATLAASMAVAGVGMVAAQEQPAEPETTLSLLSAGRVLHYVAAATGLTPWEIIEQVGAGATLAEIAEANGADAEAIVAWAVAERAAPLNRAVATGRLTREEADAQLTAIESDIRAALEGEFAFEMPHPIGAATNDVLNAVAEATGLTAQEVLAQVAGGASLAEIIEENGSDVDAVAADVVAALTERINAAVEAGAITPARADALIAALEDRVQALMDRSWPMARMFMESWGPMAGMRGMMMRGWGGMMGGPFEDCPMGDCPMLGERWEGMRDFMRERWGGMGGWFDWDEEAAPRFRGHGTRIGPRR